MIIVIIAMWLMLIGVLANRKFPRLIKAVQAVIILAGFCLLIYSLINRLHHRG